MAAKYPFPPLVPLGLPPRNRHRTFIYGGPLVWALYASWRCLAAVAWLILATLAIGLIIMIDMGLVAGWALLNIGYNAGSAAQKALRRRKALKAARG